MAATLKNQNRMGLWIVVAANFILLAAIARPNIIVSSDLEVLGRAWAPLLPAGLGLIVVGVINAQVDAATKARLVFWRWSDPLPGSEAFSRWGPDDPRVDMTALERKFGPLPTASKAQNSLWYRLYKSVESQPAVEHAHREYLFTRDYTFLASVMFVGLGAFTISASIGVAKTTLYVAFLFAQFALASQAARNHGRRLVCTVLARKAAEEENGGAA